MSRSIAESVSLLSETLTNCKTNLKDKGVESDTIKISDVDEKIAEIQAGGGNEFECTFNAIDFYTNVDDPEPYKKYINENRSGTVKGYLKMNNFYSSNIRFKKIEFELSVKNVGFDKNYTGDLWESDLILLGVMNTNNPNIEINGNINNGTGDIKITIKYDDTVTIGSNRGYPLLIFIFGTRNKDDDGNPVYIEAYNSYS